MTSFGSAPSGRPPHRYVTNTAALSQRSKSGLRKGTQGWVRDDGLVNLAG
ncbi:hypothetical protein ABZS83_31905 [Streptomyces sp. NPDC005426]